MKGSRWTDAEQALLRKLWTTAPLGVVLEAFPGRSESSIRRAADRLGVRRPTEEIVKARAAAGRKTMQLRIARSDAKAELELIQRVSIVPASQAKAVNLSLVLRNPLEAAWRGSL